MISTIRIQNFQSHEDTELELSPGINVIVGSSMNGKTAILRACNWLMSNRPLGENYVCDKSTEGETVRVFVSNEKWYISRIRSNSFNGYSLQERKGKNPPNSFDKIRAEVPIEVREALNMSDVNYQSQLSPHYLVLDSPGEVGRVINNAVRLVEIDRVIEWFSSNIRESKSKIKFLEESVLTAKEDVSRYDDIENVGEDIDDLFADKEKIEAALLELIEASDYIAFLDRSEKSIKDINKELERKEVVIGYLFELEGIKEGFSLLEDEEEKLRIVIDLFNTFAELQEEDEKDINKWYDINKSLDVMVKEAKKELVALGVCPYCGGEIDFKKASFLLEKGEG